MKHRALALCAGFLLLGVLPGSALADPPSQADQMNFPQDNDACGRFAGSLAQTFTAGETGMLTGIMMFMQSSVSDYTPMATSIYATNPTTGAPTGSALQTATTLLSPDGENRVYLSFYVPVGVTDGVKYAIVVPDVKNVWWAGSDHTYPRGEAWMKVRGPWRTVDTSQPTLGDFGFITYVDSVTPTLQWSKTSIAAGARTSLDLTETMEFVNGDDVAPVYWAHLGTLPTWFKVATIKCSPEVDEADCTLAKLQTGLSAQPQKMGVTLTFELTGTADPTSADGGTQGSATAEGCLTYPNEPSLVTPDALDPGCADATASVAVLAPAPTPTAAPTPPPTSTAPGSSEGSGLIFWFVPIGLVAALGGLLAATTRGRRRIA